VRAGGRPRRSPLGPSAVALVLLAAALHAGWNAVLRVGGDRLVVMG
jgi:hypothetical protein